MSRVRIPLRIRSGERSGGEREGTIWWIEWVDWTYALVEETMVRWASLKGEVQVRKYCITRKIEADINHETGFVSTHSIYQLYLATPTHLTHSSINRCLDPLVTCLRNLSDGSLCI
jgi:hypothetical protein